MDSVSIIIINYNYGHYLAQAIESALAQTHDNSEVIVMDDGSTDNSLEIASQYDVWLLQQPNQGACAARNNAASVATGDYLLFLDADDWLVPEAVAKLLKTLQSATTDVAYSYGQFEYFGYKEGVFASRAFSPTALAKNNYICATTLIKRTAFEAIGGYDRAFTKGNEDWELYIHFYHQGYKGQFLAEPILKYRKHKKVFRKRFNRNKRIIQTKLFLKYPSFFKWRFLKRFYRYIFYILTTPECWQLGLYGAEQPAKTVKMPSR